jgi:hypothetical protein
VIHPVYIRSLMDPQQNFKVRAVSTSGGLNLANTVPASTTKVIRRTDSFLKRRKLLSTNTDILVTNIWCIEASFLDHSTLAKLYLTSCRFLNIFRPMLSHHLTLKIRSKFTNLTTKLLCSHDNLLETLHTTHRIYLKTAFCLFTRL